MYAVLAFSHQSEYLGTKISTITEEVLFRTRRIVIEWFFIIAGGGGGLLRDGIYDSKAQECIILPTNIQYIFHIFILLIFPS